MALSAEVPMPFCPECRTEYRPGFDRCADCGAVLVERLEPERHEAPAGALLLATRDPDLLPAVTSALGAAGIPYWTTGDEAASLYAGGLEARVWVPAERLEEARTLLDETSATAPGAAAELEPEGG
jgi:hypothetical protein